MGLAAKTVFVITGPTAVGKTAVAIDVAKHFQTSILSADSRQCYIEMNIGTAKPNAEELAEVKHYFINECSVTKSLNAGDYEEIGLAYLKEIFSTNDIAVVCGGTGLYVKALCEGLDNMPHVDDEIAHEMNRMFEEHGLQWLQDAVHNEDPEFYAQGETKNPARLLRALIFKRSTGESITNFRTGKHKQRDFRTIKIGLELPREELYNRINKRVDNMMAQGLLEEVKALYPQRHLKNLQTVGYTELFQHLDGLLTLEEAVEKIKTHTRNYAKRQYTWFRKDKETTWFDANDPKLVEKIIALK